MQSPKTKKIITDNTREVTERFLIAMHDILLKSPGVRFKARFAQKVGINAQNLSSMEHQPVPRSVTLNSVVLLCKEFKVSPEWILLGTGNMYCQDIKGEIEGLNEMLQHLRSRLAN